MKKTRSKKSRDTVPLGGPYCTAELYRKFDNTQYFLESIFLTKATVTSSLQGIKLHSQTYCDSALCGKMQICMTQFSTEQLHRKKPRQNQLKNISRRKVLLCICQSAGLNFRFFCIINKPTLSYDPNYTNVLVDEKSFKTINLLVLSL